jgi:RNA polymerase sigma-70 factor (ECF subfamily)
MTQPLDQAGLKAALKQHHDAAWAWALACCQRDRDAAHDVLHDAYLTVLQRRARYLGRSTFKTWLFGVIRVCAQAARRRKRLLGLIFDPIVDHPHLAEAPAEPALLATSQRLRRELLALPIRQRQVVALVFEQDLTLDEASEVLGISPGACRKHYARAKTRLRSCVGDREADDE